MKWAEESNVLLAATKIRKEVLLKLTNRMLPVLWLSLLVSLLYLFTRHFYSEYDANNVPSGDPFTYTISWFHAILAAHKNYWDMLWKIIRGKSSWYQLQVLLVTLFSPVLTLSPMRICIVNFFSFFLATFFWYRLIFLVFPQRYLALACSLCYWIFPAHYGMHYATALFILQLDTMFFNIFCAAVACMLIYSLDSRRSNAILAAIMISLAIWGRGNSLPYILIAVFIPAAILLKEYGSFKDRKLAKRLLINTGILCIIVFICSYLFYIHHLDTILTYYSPHYHIVRNSYINWSNIISIMRNIPGIFFIYAVDSKPTIIITIIIHIVVISAILLIFVKPLCSVYQQRTVKSICICGLFIFYGIFIAIALVFNTNSLIIWYTYVPMLAGLYLILLSIILYFIFLNQSLFTKVAVSKIIFGLIAFFMLIYGYIMSNLNTPTIATDVNSPSPKQMIFFSTHMESIFGNASVAFLWYLTYNQPVINYYRIMYGLPEISDNMQHLSLHFYNNPYWQDLWIPTPQADLKRMKKGLQLTMSQADYIIMPDCINSYNPKADYPLYQYANLLMNALNSPSAPRFKVKMVLQETDTRLLVLQRLNKGDLLLSASELLPKPFPQYPRCRTLTYHNASGFK